MTITPEQAARLLEKAESAQAELASFVDTLRQVVRTAQTPSLFDHEPDPALVRIQELRDKVGGINPDHPPRCMDCWTLLTGEGTCPRCAENW